MKKMTSFFMILFMVIFITANLYTAIHDEYSLDKAERIDKLLKKIGKSQRNSVFLKNVTFSQDELNSYLNLIYIKKYTPEINYIKLKLEKDNYVDGTVKIKLDAEKYDKVPSFLRNIEVQAMGKVECNNYRMRFLFEKILVNGTPFSPEILDEGFGAAQGNVPIKKSLYDWFSLLPGLKSVTIDEKKITLYY